MMNKRCYRIIFNRARRMLVVVSELARAQGGDTGRGPGQIAAHYLASLRPLTLALWLAGGLVSTGVQAGTIVPDHSAPGGQQPTVMQTGNGLPQINIQTPNSQGLSHNTYSQFDVNQQGAILNNSQHGAQTQLAGTVAGNPWLAQGTATVILNEVNSTNPSQLNGFIEVAGAKANVIIANPAGITCSGCGFINAGRNTLAAGRARLENGQVAGYDVDRGNITISGSGMNGTGQDYTTLIARAVNVNARLQANNLQVTLGHNQTDADGKVTQVKADDPDGRPQFALDTSALGGMYANRITLVGTEQGVGVRNAGELGATAGSFTLSANGKLTNSGTVYAQQDLALNTRGLDNSGGMSSGNDLSVSNQDDMTNRGQLIASRNLQVDSSGQLHSQAGSSLIAGGNTTINAHAIQADTGSAMGAGIDNTGYATQSGQLTLNTEGALVSHGTHLSQDAIVASGSEVDVSGSQSRAGNVSLTAREGNLNADNAVVDAQQVSLTTPHAFSSRQGTLAASHLTINAPDLIDNSGGSLTELGPDPFSLSSQQIDNTGGTIAAAGDLRLTSNQLTNTGGQLGADQGSLTIQSDNIADAQGKMLAGNNLSITGQQITLDQGVTQGAQISLQGTNLSHQGAHLLQTGQGTAQIHLSGQLNNIAGVMESAGAFSLDTGGVDNTQGRIASNNDLAIETHQGDLINGNSEATQGGIRTDGSLHIQAGDMNNAAGLIVGHQLDVTAGNLSNRGGTLESQQGLAIDAHSLDSHQGLISADNGDATLHITGDADNSGGNLQSAGNLTFTGGDLNNQAGNIQASTLGLTAGQINNQQGYLTATDALTLKGQSVENQAGLISAGNGHVGLDLTGGLSNAQGTVQSQQDMTLNAASLTNDGGKLLSAGGAVTGTFSGEVSNQSGQILAEQALQLNAAQVNNQQGVIASTQGDTQLTAAGALNNQGGDVESGQHLTLNTGALDNSAGRLLANDAMQISATGLTNDQGLIQSQHDLHLDTHAGTLNNADTLSNKGGIRSGGALTLTTGDVDNHNGLITGNQVLAQGQAWNNQKGELESQQGLALDAHSLDSRQGFISADDGDANLNITGDADNSGGNLQSAGNLTLHAQNLNNQSGRVAAQDSLSLDLQGGGLNNSQTSADGLGILAGHDLTFTGGDLNNQAGNIQASTLDLTAGQVNNQQGYLTATDALTIKGQSVENQSGLISAGNGRVGVDLTGGLSNAQGTVQSQQDMTLNAASLTNDGGKLLSTGGAVTGAFSGEVSNQSGQILADQALQLNAAQVNNQQGVIASTQGDTQLTAAGTLNNQGGDVESGQHLTLNTGALDNSAGRLLANDAMQISATSLTNDQGLIQSQHDLHIDTHAGTLSNADTLSNKGGIRSGGALTLTTGDVDNHNGLITGNQVQAQGQAWNNQKGELDSSQGLTLTGTSLSNLQGLISAAGGNLTTTFTQDIDNQQGTLQSSQGLTLNAGSLNNTGGAVLAAGGDASVTLQGQIGNQQGQVLARDNLQVTATTIDNQAGTLSALNGDANLEASSDVLNQGGVSTAAGALTLKGRSIDNTGGQLVASGGPLTVSAVDSLINQQGRMTGQGDVQLTGQSLDNSGGTLTSVEGEFNALIHGAINNQSGVMQSGHGVTVQSDALDNRKGEVLAVAGGNNLAVTGDVLNSQGKILSAQDISLQAGSLGNQNGIVSSQQGALNINGGSAINNQGGALEGDGPVQISAGQLDNTRGSLLSASDGLNVSVNQALNNQQGRIAAGKDVHLNANTLNNQQGTVTAVGGGLTVETNPAMRILARIRVLAAGSTLDNSDGTLQSSGDLLLNTQTLNNQNGIIQSTQGDNQLTLTGALNNQQGTLSAGHSLTMQAGDVENSGGAMLGDTLSLTSQQLDNSAGLIQGTHQLTIDTQGQQLDNSDTAGSTTGLRTGGDFSLKSGDLNNQKGLITANTLNAATQAVNNEQGQINSTGDSQLTSLTLDNQNGAIQSGGNLTLNTQQSDLLNQQGSLIADQSLAITAAAIHNGQGVIQGNHGLTLQGTTVDNTQGRLMSGSDLTAVLEQLTNNNGILFATGNADITALQQVQNQQGLIKAGQALHLTAPQIDNHDTRGANQGIEAQNLILSSDTLNNQSGALRAVDALQANVRQQVDNQQGLISSQNSLTLGQTDQRPTLNNSDGDIVANGDANLQVGQIANIGRITSGGNLTLDTTSALTQDGTLSAGKDFTLNTHGNALTNSSALTATGQLTLEAGSVENQQNGKINAGTTHLIASDILNQGLIDGGNVLLQSDTLHNTGTGRIYGDDLTIAAQTLTNDKTADTAGTIAAREQLNLAAGHLLNQDHGLIYSAGDMHIGGALDANGALTGQAALVENLSATLESMGNMQIDAGQTENRDIHLAVSPDLQTVSTSAAVLDIELCTGEKWVDACGRTDGVHYHFNAHESGTEQNDYTVDFVFDADGRSYALDDQGNRLKVTIDGKDDFVYFYKDPDDSDSLLFNLPGVTTAGRRFDVFQYNQTVKEQVVTQQDSALIRSGGDLTLNGGLHNKDSQVVAGQDLTINGSVNNDETTVRQEITDDGNRLTAGKRKKHDQTHYEGPETYQPPVSDLNVPLHLAQQLQNQGQSQGQAIDARQSSSAGTSAAAGLNGAVALTRPVQLPQAIEVSPSSSQTSMQLSTVAGHLSDSGVVAKTALQTRGNASGGLTQVALNQNDPLTATQRGEPGMQTSGNASGGLTQVALNPGDALTAAPSSAGSAPLGGIKSAPANVSTMQDKWVLRSVTGPVKLPDNSLYSLHPGTDSHYLVETDPQFTQGNTTVSSSDVYSQDQLQKRLGDGYYEQSLVRDQVMKTTGQRYLTGYTNDEDEYRDLLNSGKAYTERFGITPGVDLTPEQMASVTSDMVIMVNETVTLPDGSTQQVSIPKLYARVQPDTLNGDGTLLAGNNVKINTAGDLINSGTITGRNLTSLSATDLLNTGDISGNTTQLVASNDLVNRDGQISGGDALTLQAGHDVLSLTDSHQDGTESWLDRQAGINVKNDNGSLTLAAGHDIQLTASVVSNQGTESQTSLVAGHDIVLDTAMTSHATDYTRDKNNYDRSQESQETGSTINAGGDLTLQAGHDMTLRAADVTATKDATLLAGNSLTLESGEDSWDQQTSSKWKSHHGLSTTKTQVQTSTQQKSAVSTTLSGDTVTAVANNDLTLTGSNIAGTHDVLLSAGHDLTLTTADEMDHDVSITQKKKSGLSGTGGIGFSVGSTKQKLTSDDTSNVKKGSVAGSSEGNLTLVAGNEAVIHGSDVVAGQDMHIQGRDVAITAAENSHTALTKTEIKSSGLTLGLSGAVGSALNSATQQATSAAKEDNGRLAALRGTQAALTGFQASQAARLAGVSDNPADKNTFGLTLSYGSQKSTTESRTEQQTSSGSSLQAGRDMTIQATGGDLAVQGSQLKAGGDMTLAASRDISLTSGENSEQQSQTSKSHGGSLGVGFVAGSGSAGFSVSASVSQSKGKVTSSNLSHTLTTLDAGDGVTLDSGRDTTLQGAQVNGASVIADVGRNLQLTSEQGSNRYDSKQTGSSLGAGMTWGAGAAAGGSASVSATRDKMHSNYDSVQEQTGLFAGQDGFDVTVGGHTQLDGAVIGSTATADKNRLDTGTLGFSDIDNHADYQIEHQGVGFSTGGSIGSQFIGNMANGLLSGMNGSGSADSLTRAAVSVTTNASPD
ncbi:hemagglutinin repeat-containing protein [Pantoea cypripedii]|nr:hemagglutinin repeat-containing protein [Pantoea cypripedii]